MVIIGISTFISCDKSDPTATGQKILEKSSKREIGPGPIIVIKAKPYRQTHNRKRDGKDCGCNTCFGICDVRIGGGIGFTTIIIQLNQETNLSTIYFTESLSNFDTEFGIDNDIIIPTEALVNTDISSLILKKGIYSFVEDNSYISMGDSTYHTYGYVSVLHEIN
jgi:hypothetical protein